MEQFRLIAKVSTFKVIAGQDLKFPFSTIQPILVLCY